MTEQPTAPQGLPAPGPSAGPPPSQTPTQPWAQPPEAPGPAPGLRFGPPGPRLVAYIIDVLIVGAITVLIWIVLGIFIGLAAVGGSAGGVAALVLLGLVASFIVSVAYFPFFWLRWGSTPGMRMFNLRVVRDGDGGPISGSQAVLRLIGYWISAWIFYLGYIWVFIDGRKRGWYDLIAGTCVVQPI
ncbi:MAG: RDD family protein [Candidatus Limnocylindrales bacterium]